MNYTDNTYHFRQDSTFLYYFGIMLIHFYRDIDQWELYDLKEDPEEIHNLYGKNDYKEITGSLFEKMVELQILYKTTTAVNALVLPSC